MNCLHHGSTVDLFHFHCRRTNQILPLGLKVQCKQDAAESGKSTLIQHFNALVKPTSGKIIINGIDVTAPKADLRLVRKTVGLVFQYPEHQLFEETVYKDIAFGPKNMGFSDEKIDKRVRESAALVGLKEKHLTRSPFDLSGGQKRRVAIAGVLAMNPKVLILDESTDWVWDLVLPLL